MLEINDELLAMINDYNEYISKITKGSLKLAELLRERKVDDSLKSILSFSEGITWLLHVNDEFKKVAVFTGIEKEKLLGILEEINEALEKEDYYLVADIFEYEVNEYFNSLNTINLES